MGSDTMSTAIAMSTTTTTTTTAPVTEVMI